MQRFGLILLATLIGSGPVRAETGTTGPEVEASPSRPPEVALGKEGANGSVYRQFPSGLLLYTSDRDPPGTSTCYQACVEVWLPVYAPANSRAVGEWQVLRRLDGKLQWMFRDKPVYTRNPKAPGAPIGKGTEDVWHIVPYI